MGEGQCKKHIILTSKNKLKNFIILSLLKSPIKIICVDSNPIFLKGLVSFLSEYTEFEVLAYCSTTKILFESLEKNLMPDLIMLDVEVLGINYLEILKILKKEFTNTKLILTAVQFEDGYMNYSFNLGVNSYLLKNDTTLVYVESIKNVMQSGFYFNANAINHYSKFSNCKMSLSTKEKEILLLLCQGLILKEIANKLGRSITTIDFHKKNILKKNTMQK